MAPSVAFPFKHPFTAICSGPTGCGKTVLMKRLIQHVEHVVRPRPERVLWYYNEHQPDLVHELGHLVQFREGCPELADFNDNRRTLVVVDDMMTECSAEITNLFTRGSHHRNLSIWFLMQNIFHKAKEIRTITLNAQYIVLFKNPRDRQQIKVLARQMFDGDAKVMEKAFEMATAEPHGYLLVDLKQDTDELHRLRSKIVPGERLEVFVGKRAFKDAEMVVYS